MKKTVILLQILAIIFLLLPFAAYAVPNLISYQGTLSDANGLPISSTMSMTFRIYNAATGGSELWSETQNVPVSNGLFNVKLGSVNSIPPSLFEQDVLYLGIQAASDSEMIPRQQITSGSFVYKAAHADKASELEQTIVPIGSIIAWAKAIPGVPALPDGWVECNGQTISDSDSPIDGQTLPDLNGQSRFLRGNSSSGGVGGSVSHSHKRGATGGTYDGWDATGRVMTDVQPHLPPYYDVVWIIKIK